MSSMDIQAASLIAELSHLCGVNVPDTSEERMHF
jgi:hypothetical protein